MGEVRKLMYVFVIVHAGRRGGGREVGREGGVGECTTTCIILCMQVQSNPFLPSFLSSLTLFVSFFACLSEVCGEGERERRGGGIEGGRERGGRMALLNTFSFILCCGMYHSLNFLLVMSMKLSENHNFLNTNVA